MGSDLQGAGVNLAALVIACGGAVAVALVLAMVLPWPLGPFTGLAGIPIGWATYARWGAFAALPAPTRQTAWGVMRSHAVRAAPLYAVVLWTAWAARDAGRGALLFGTVPFAPALAAAGGIAALARGRRSGAGTALVGRAPGAPLT